MRTGTILERFENVSILWLPITNSRAVLVTEKRTQLPSDVISQNWQTNWRHTLYARQVSSRNRLSSLNILECSSRSAQPQYVGSLDYNCGAFIFGPLLCTSALTRFRSKKPRAAGSDISKVVFLWAMGFLRGLIGVFSLFITFWTWTVVCKSRAFLVPIFQNFLKLGMRFLWGLWG